MRRRLGVACSAAMGRVGAGYATVAGAFTRVGQLQRRGSAGGQALEWDVQQACARGERLAGVRRPCGATALRTVGRTDELR